MTPFSSVWTRDRVPELLQIAREAGACILTHRAEALYEVVRKEDDSPVTQADHGSQHIIVRGLSALTPQIPIVSEEKDNPAALASDGMYWLVDPLDATRDFVAGGDEFSVNIGLIVDHRPIVGLIYVPSQALLYYGDPEGVFCLKHGRPVDLVPPAKTSGLPRVLSSLTGSKSLPLKLWAEKNIIGAYRLCSSALKFGLLAEGAADLYPRIGGTCEWDTAAGDAILRALGGGIVTLDGNELAYSKPEFKNGYFLAYGPSFDTSRIGAFLDLLNALNPAQKAIQPCQAAQLKT